MINSTDQKRIWIFLAIAFGISWATALVIYQTGGLADSPILAIGGGQLSLALVLMATFYMFGPAVANILTRWITKEGRQNLLMKPNFDRRRWIYYVAAWVLPGVLTILGMALYFLAFPGNYDSGLSVLSEQMELLGADGISPWAIVAAQTVQAIMVAPLLNGLPTFGEEFGWRGYLLPKLMPLGSRKAVLLSGVIWGVWHWPIILMGYNYGLDYFGAPFLGPLAMVWFTIVFGALLAWVTIKSGSVWPAVIGHGALNGIAGLSLIFIAGEPNTVLGPTPVGLIGGLGFTILAVTLFQQPNAFKPIPEEMTNKP